MSKNTRFTAWASGSKRSRYNDKAYLTLKPEDTNGVTIIFGYTPGFGWECVQSVESELNDRLFDTDCQWFCNLLFKYLVKDDMYGTKICWQSDGELVDVTIY
jgi:hypothetical protein